MDQDLETLVLAGASDRDIEDVILHHIFASGNDAGDSDIHSRSFDLDAMAADDVKIHFRFDKQDIHRLARALRIPEVIRTATRNSVSGITGLCILLRRLAYPGRLKDMKFLFGLSPQSLSQIIGVMLSYICEQHMHLLNDLQNVAWLNEERMEFYADAVRRKGGAIPNCWGFIDGTARAICRPSINQEEYYSGHKRMHCVKYQSVLCPDGMIVNLKGPYVGRRHDAGIYRQSQLSAELQEVALFPDGRKYVLYGDQAYPLSDLLMCPYPTRQEGLLEHQQEFNNSMKVIRTAVEWGFQKTVTQFAFVDFKKNQKLLLQDIEALYKVSVLLTNCHTTLYGSQTSQFFDALPPTLECYLGS